METHALKTRVHDGVVGLRVHPGGQRHGSRLGDGLLDDVRGTAGSARHDAGECAESDAPAQAAKVILIEHVWTDGLFSLEMHALSRRGGHIRQGGQPLACLAEAPLFAIEPAPTGWQSSPLILWGAPRLLRNTLDAAPVHPALRFRANRPLVPPQLLPRTQYDRRVATDRHGPVRRSLD